MSPTRRLLWGACILGAIIVAGVIGYEVIEGWSFIDALYMTIITITTVGYAEVHPLTAGGQIFSIFLIAGEAKNDDLIFGAVCVFSAICALTSLRYNGADRKYHMSREHHTRMRPNEYEIDSIYEITSFVIEVHAIIEHCRSRWSTNFTQVSPDRDFVQISSWSSDIV